MNLDKTALIASQCSGSANLFTGYVNLFMQVESSLNLFQFNFKYLMLYFRNLALNE